MADTPEAQWVYIAEGQAPTRFCNLDNCFIEGSFAQERDKHFVRLFGGTCTIFLQTDPMEMEIGAKCKPTEADANILPGGRVVVKRIDPNTES